MRFKQYYINESYGKSFKPKGGWVKWKDSKTGKTIEVEKERPWGQSYTVRHIKNKWNILTSFTFSGKQYLDDKGNWDEAMDIPREYLKMFTIDGTYNKAKNNKTFKSYEDHNTILVPAVTYRVPLDFPEISR